VVAPSQRASSFRRSDEQSGPGHYAVTLKDHGVRAEVTAVARAGILRFRFDRPEHAHVLVELNFKKDERRPDGFVRVLPERREIVGTSPVRRLYAGLGKPAGFSGHFVARFDQPFEAFGTYTGHTPRAGETVARGDVAAPGAYVRFAPRPGQTVLVRVGTSFTSIDEARRNLDAEIPKSDFEGTRARAERTWEEALGRIRVRGGTASERTIFYTALYHALLMPRLFSDVSGTYPGFASSGKTLEARGWEYYDDFSLWDTFRAVHPLFVLAYPERVPSMIRSLVAKAEQGGWLPNFPGWNSYTSAMIGDHGAAVIADAVVKGIRGFDVRAAYAAVRKNALQSPPPDEYADGKGRRALPDYLRLGYIPLEQPVVEAFHKREQVSRTLEYAYDDFAVAQVAHAVGEQDDSTRFFARSRNYRNVIDPQTRFARGRHSDGSWVEPFDHTKEQPYITEGTPFQYTFFAPHDVQGLIERLGGRESFVARLDDFFDGGHNWHGNEPSHHIAYLYTHAGAPWRTQERVRKLLASEYGLGPTGLRGNDDTGQMSAWYVFSALGFYPVCPGSPHYELGSPLFTQARIAVGEGRTFTVRASRASARNLYVRQASLDGKPHPRPWLAHQDVARGGVLTLDMSPTPEKRWGTAPPHAPPSPANDRPRP